MSPSRDSRGKTVYRLDGRLLIPMLILLVMPAAVVIRSLIHRGLSPRNVVGMALLAVIILLFSPWLTRKVTITPAGIRSSSIFRRRYLSWGEVRRVRGLTFRGRAMIFLQGDASRVMLTDMLGGFKRLVGYVIEYASAAVIEDDVAPTLMVEGP